MSDEAIGAALERAGQALAEGDLDRAEAAFYAALEMAPGDGTLLGGLAVVSMQRGDMEEAARRGRVAVDAGARGVEVPYNLGFALLQLDRREEAVDAFLAAFALDPTRPEPIGQLLQLGRVPAQEGEEPGEPLALETLERLELYQHLALRQAGGAEVDSFEGAWVWATERGAPWGRTAAWLMQQGAHCDREVLARLPERDEHLARSVVAGLILAPNDVAEAALRELPGVILIGPDDPVPELPEPAEHPGGDFLVVRLDPVADRPQIPSQRTHAAVVFSALVDRLHAFGSESAVVLTVDPAAHVGPRRAWVITPVSEAEVVAEWSGADVEGRPLDEPLLPGADAPEPPRPRPGQPRRPRRRRRVRPGGPPRPQRRRPLLRRRRRGPPPRRVGGPADEARPPRAPRQRQPRPVAGGRDGEDGGASPRGPPRRLHPEAELADGPEQARPPRSDGGPAHGPRALRGSAERQAVRGLMGP
jgi:hypothetical protein